MKFNKAGRVHPFVWVMSILLVIAAVIGTVSYFSTHQTSTSTIIFQVEPSQSIGEVIEQPSFNWLSYFVGRVPEWLISSTNNISAAIIIIAIWLILLLAFGDIVSAFGTFSNEYIGWGIGTLLAIVAANFKAVMWIATLSFSITSGLGVLSVFAALAIPFVIFLLIQFGSSWASTWQLNRRRKYYAATGLRRITTGLETAGEVGRATEEQGRR